ncbi:hypothetical protein [Paenibacillus gorillae]|uniref:hypothetical protein n=1 Tax=Paenibacillus gorillae TaxID=1243662 RepID=UPI0004AE4421|nr:hypothetical protein [Paenibacillus gorillae]
MLNLVVSFVMRLLFYRMPPASFTEDEVHTFERIYADAIFHEREIRYEGPYSKHRFCQYIAINKPVILHGSNDKEISEFETRRQTRYNGQYVEAVFGTKDGIWPLFYAVFDRSKLSGNFRNACFKVKGNRRYYFFSLTPETIAADPWTDGMIYFLPRQSFDSPSNSLVSFDEWISTTPVAPIAKLEVTSQDFPLKDKVARHRQNEPIVVSWLLYKLRIKRK